MHKKSKKLSPQNDINKTKSDFPLKFFNKKSLLVTLDDVITKEMKSSQKKLTLISFFVTYVINITTFKSFPFVIPDKLVWEVSPPPNKKP